MKKSLFTFALLLLSASIQAKSDISVFTGVSYLDLDIEENRSATGIDINDSFSTVRFGVAAYRWSTEKSAWGFVAEIEQAFGRDSDEGSGRLLGVRPVNWKYQWNPSISTQMFFGAARYEWEEGANGYYAGASLDYKLPNTSVAISFEGRYFRDLNYDTNNGDLFINGPSIGLNVSYQF